jgi:SAM-dependent methyltransferase
MRTQWDYTALADTYIKRPDYAAGALDQLVSVAGIQPGVAVCDVGAGAAHLTIPLAERGFAVTAVEPNDAMRAHGIARTAKYPSVQWVEATGENTGQPAGHFKLVVFGSSFNVTEPTSALRESARILQRPGWFACLWNHRDLADPLQADIEAIIRRHVSDYDYGARRMDQTAVIDASGLFGTVVRFECATEHQQSAEDCLEAWRSHGTLHRQAKDGFPAVIDEIGQLLARRTSGPITIPYTTRVWVAPVL